MQILRPPPGSRGSEGTEDVSPSKKWFLQFVFAFLFLVIGMVIFFVGGVVVRNPQLPNYLLDQIVTRFRGGTGKTANSVSPKNYVSSAENLRPPATPEQYLNLMSFDERTLPPDERAAVSVLNQTVAHLEESSFAKLTLELAPLFNDQIVPGVAKLQPGVDLLAKNPSKWKRAPNGTVLFATKATLFMGQDTSSLPTPGSSPGYGHQHPPASHRLP